MADAPRRRRRNRRREQPLAGILGPIAATVVVLGGVLLAWNWWNHRPSAEKAVATVTQQAAKKRVDVARDDAEAPEPAGRFEFYDVLPDAQVQVDTENHAPVADPLPPVTAPGVYVLQAGAFPDVAEAGKVKARLATLGVASEIQQAESNGTTFHRVRIGPIESLDELNRLRARLRQNQIEFIVIPIDE